MYGTFWRSCQNKHTLMANTTQLTHTYYHNVYTIYYQASTTITVSCAHSCHTLSIMQHIEQLLLSLCAVHMTLQTPPAYIYIIINIYIPIPSTTHSHIQLITVQYVNTVCQLLPHNVEIFPSVFHFRMYIMIKSLQLFPLKFHA